MLLNRCSREIVHGIRAVLRKLALFPTRKNVDQAPSIEWELLPYSFVLDFFPDDYLADINAHLAHRDLLNSSSPRYVPTYPVRDRSYPHSREAALLCAWDKHPCFLEHEKEVPYGVPNQ